VSLEPRAGLAGDFVVLGGVLFTLRSLLRSPAVRQAVGNYFPVVLENQLHGSKDLMMSNVAQSEITQRHILCDSFGNRRRELSVNPDGRAARRG
jgi:hypothetical protein